MQKFMKTILSAVKTWTQGKIKDSTADWNQNDPNADNYVKNRTHWEEYKKVSILKSTKINASSQPFIEMPPVSSLVVGQEYVVTYDGVKYNCIAYLVDNGGVAVGNGDLFLFNPNNKGNDEPFFFVSFEHDISFIFSANPGIHTISIDFQGAIIHKLDSKYLDIPTNVATTDDIEILSEDIEFLSEEMTQAQQDIEDNSKKLLTYENDRYILPGRYSSWNSIVYGNDTFVAVSGTRVTYNESIGEIVYSKNGINWSKANAPSGDWSSVTYGNGMFVALYKGNYTSRTVIYSLDGINWQAIKHNAGTSWNAITYGNGKFVAVGGSIGSYPSYAICSSDGLNWRVADMPKQSDWNSIVYGNGMFVATSQHYMSHSSDGVTWSDVSECSSCKLSYGNGKFVAVGEDYSGYSTNGIDWTSTNIPPMDETWGWIESVTYGLNKFVAVGGGYYQYNPSRAMTDYVIYSVDGINWERAYLPSKQHWSSVTCDGNKFIAIAYGDKRVAYSTDGINWQYGDDEDLLQNDEIKTDAIRSLLLDGYIIPTPETATVGQTIVVKSVDENGKPTEWETVELPSINGLATEEYVNNTIVQSDWNQNDETAIDFIKNKPTLTTTTTAGLMSASDKTKLDGIEAGANATEIDSTLSIEGAAADAKAVGDISKIVDTLYKDLEAQHILDQSIMDKYWWYVPLNAPKIEIYYQGSLIKTFNRTSMSTSNGANMWKYGNDEEADATAFFDTYSGSDYVRWYYDESGNSVTAEYQEREVKLKEGKGKCFTYMFGYLAYLDEEGNWVRPNDWFPISCAEEGNFAKAMDFALKYSLAISELATEEYVNNAIVQFDWSQNDETKLDYIKNRTHWIEPEYETIVPLQTTTSQHPIIELGTFPLNDEFDFPEDAVFVIDGISYEVSNWYDDFGENYEKLYGDSRLGTWVDGASINQNSHPENVPFLAIFTWYDPEITAGGWGSSVYQLCMDFSEDREHTVEVKKRVGTIYHKLDINYLPIDDIYNSIMDRIPNAEEASF